jgi:hypothetical protein
MRIQRILPVGSDLDSAALPVGEIRSIRIDNPSGQWLQLFPTYDYIPPYTIGFARTFQTTVQTITIKRNTPAGQVATQQGDAVKVYLDSDPAPADSDGVPFIDQFTPVLIAVNATSQVPLAGLSGTLVAAQANRRFRLLTLDARLGYSNVSGIYPVCGVDFIVQDNSGSGTALIGRLSPAKPSSERAYPAGVDFAVGAAIIFSAATDWADSLLLLSITYQVI